MEDEVVDEEEVVEQFLLRETVISKPYYQRIVSQSITFKWQPMVFTAYNVTTWAYIGIV